ncbi:hypothetical protein [Primorskyibacter sp. 2E233]|uniref:hypothetical protein n=1 Tax=Primorskyibacter sp. 2E233 TaxID=3413431 RepID=UPI003BF361B2
MSGSKAVLVAVLAITVSGCAQTQRIMATSRNNTAFLIEPVAQTSESERALVRSAEAGSSQADCGTALSDPSMAECSEKQLLGRYIGTLRGTGPAANRVDVNSFIPALAESYEHLESVDTGVTAMLEQQSAELALLKQQRAAGELSDHDYSVRVTAMKQSREAVGEALKLSANQAATAQKLFKKAQAKGQDGLSWYVLSLGHVEEVTKAAKARLAAAG